MSPPPRCCSGSMSEPPFDPSPVSPSARVLSMVVANDRRELARIGERVERFASECRLSADHAASLNLVLDELVSNVIKYGYEDQRPHEIERERRALITAQQQVRIGLARLGRELGPVDEIAAEAR